MIPATLDINVLVSSVLGPRGLSRRIIQAWAANQFSHVTSLHIISVLEAKLTDADIVRRFPFWPAAGHELAALLRSQASVIAISAADIPPVTGDPEDDTVLATARLGKSSYLVTGDRTLLALGEYEGVRIVTPRGFLTILEEDAAW